MVKAAIIGYGGIGKWHHQGIREAVPGLEVIGAYDVREEALAESKANGLKAYGSAQELFDDPAVQLVIITTPNDSHKEYIIRGLKAGKHVLCEKPVVLSSADLREAIEVSKDAPGVFTIHQNRRWDKDFQIVKSLIHDGKIGKPYFIESRVHGSSVFLHGWRGHRINGGGMLYDWGVHLIDQALQLFPEKVVSVTAQLFSVHAQEVDDNFKLLLGFESGVSVLIEVATNCFIPAPRWHVSGEVGTVVIQDWCCDGRIVKLAEDQEFTWEPDIIYTPAGPTRTMAPRPPETMVEYPLPELKDAHGNAYHQWSSVDIFYHNLLDAIAGKAELYVKPEEALRVMDIIELAFQSSREGRGLACSI